MLVCEPVGVYVHLVHAGAWGGQKKAQIPRNGNYEYLWATMWVLGTKPWSSVRAVSAFNQWAIFPVPTLLYTRSLPDLRAYQLEETSWTIAVQTSSYLFLPSTGIIIAAHPTWILTWVLGIQTQGCTLAWQALYWLCHFPWVLDNEHRFHTLVKLCTLNHISTS